MKIPSNRIPPHPGELLLNEFLVPLGISQTDFADRINVSFQRINTIIKGKREISIDTALRFSKFFGNSPEFWLNAQRAINLYREFHSKKYLDIQKIPTYTY